MKTIKLLSLALLFVLLLVALSTPQTTRADWSKVDAWVLDRLETDGTAEFYVILAEQADLSGATALGTKVDKTTYVFNALRQMSERTQAPLLAYLQTQGVSHRSWYIMNAISVSAGESQVEWLAARPEVARISRPPDPQKEPVYKQIGPQLPAEAVEWNVLRIGAPDVWAMGYHGEGFVVASNDTGVDYTHPALVGKYRGNLGGGNFDHNYNWWGAPGSVFPFDGDGHGTHTTGTMVGDDGGANQIGVAPGAQWIACAGLGGADTFECFQFFLTPWDLNGQNPDPSKSPDAINNSWYDPSGFDYRPIIQNLNAAGIAVIKSAGNQGPGCSTISNPGYVPEIIATAAFAQGDTIASFSSRGPMSNYGETILKPEVAAPGVNVRSSVPGGGYEGGWSGTSMAAPHTTALVALMWNAAPCLAGDVPLTKQIMMDTAEAKVDAQCPPFVDHPNDVWGWGILDAELAVQTAIAFCGGTGELEGTVFDEIANPLPDILVQAEASAGFTRSDVTDASGAYSMTLLADTYTLTASAYGYLTEIITSITIVTDTITTQDVILTASPSHTVSGYVLEAGTNNPLVGTVQFLDAPVPPVTSTLDGFYNLSVAEGVWHLQASADEHLPQTVVVTVTGDLSQDFSLEPLPCILLVDDDGDGPDVRSYYTAALDDLSLEYTVWDVLAQGDPTADDLAGYNMVLWLTGYPYSNTFKPENEAAVSAYLDDGGNFFLSSQDYLYNYGLTLFGMEYLHIASFDSDVNQTTVTGQNAFAGLGPYALSYPYTNYSDVVNPDANAEVAFLGNVGNAAITYEGTSFNTVFLGFPFEAIPSLDDRSEVMQAVADFLGGCCDPAVAEFTWQPAEPLVDVLVTFTALGGGEPPITYTWDLGDGAFAGGSIITHTYDLPGDFTVVLTATNACGVDSASHMVTVSLPPPDIIVTPPEPELTLLPGEYASLPFTITNAGVLTLTFEISETVGWLSVDPLSGALASAASQAATAAVDATGLAPGIYPALVAVLSNDPDTPVVSFPITLTVMLPPPLIVIEPLTLTMTLEEGQSGVMTFTIVNDGGEALTYAIANEADWAAAVPVTGTLQGGDSAIVSVIFDAGALAPGDYHALLEVTSNDPAQPSLSVHLALTVEAVFEYNFLPLVNH